MAPQIHQVSIERIQGEIVRILTEGQAGTGLQMLHDSGLLRQVLPEVQWTSHLAHCLAMLERGVASDLAMAVLLHEVPVADVERIMERLKFSRLEINQTVCLVTRIPQFHTVRNMSIASLKKFFRLPRFDGHLELERICRTTSDAHLEDYDFALKTFRGWTPEEISPAPLITGEDLITMEFPRGPVYKEILSVVEDEQLEGRLTTRDAAIEFVKNRYGRKS
jgi:poly(A) polymerase